MRTVTKKELVNRIAEQTGATKVVAKDIIQSFLDTIIEELAVGNRLEFREFGVFESKERAARRAQNPRTLEKVNVPAKRIVKFKVGRMMRQRVSDGGGEEAVTGSTPSLSSPATDAMGSSGIATGSSGSTPGEQSALADQGAE
ncbi:MAG: HU family DNA-binding protein [Planctomycetota bacterium]|nr:HU family DNA-binding protein [Planctomycetota bacterium]